MISEEFLDWTKDNGLSYPSLEAALVEEGWRGLICTKSLRAGELLVEVPQSCLMSSRSARACPVLGPILASAKAGTAALSDVEIVAIHLLFESSKGRESFWGPYIDQLPPRFDGYTTLPYFTALHAAELQCLAALEVVEDGKLKLHAEWRRCKACLDALGLRGEHAGLEAFRWATATISSRTMHVVWSPAGAFVPYADFFNYRPPPPPATPQLQLGEPAMESTRPGVCGDGFFDPSAKTYKIFTHVSYARGQQVFLCYGAHTNLELLEHYGFLLQDNPHDTVLLPPELLCSEERQSGVLNGLPTHVSVPAKECYITRNGVPSWEVMKALRLACLGSRQRKSCGYLAAAGQPCSTESEIQVMRLIRHACTRHLASKATSLEKDEVLLEAAQSEGAESLQLAISWRLCQKQILRRGIAVADKVIEELTTVL